MSNPVRIEEPAQRDAPSGRFALWALGFRPFYLLASIFAALSIAQWVLQYTGVLAYPGAESDDEMPIMFPVEVVHREAPALVVAAGGR